MIDESAIRAHCLAARENGHAIGTHHGLEVTIDRDGRNYKISAGALGGAPVVAQNVGQVVQVVSEAIDRREVWIGDGQPDRPAWLEWRRGGLGGSDVAGVLGLSSWSSPWDVWRSKRHEVQVADSAAMERGRRLESAIGEWTRDRLGAKRLSVGRPCQHPDRPWMRGTPDGWLDGVGLEIKTCRSWDGWGEDGTDQIPAVYRTQVLWYMAITGRDRWVLSAFSPMTDQLRIYQIKADPQVLAALVETAGQWWQTHVIEDTEPPIDGSPGCAAGLAELHAEPRDTYQDADADAVALVDAWQAAAAEAKAAKAKADKLQNEVKALIGDDTGLKADRGSVRWSRYTTTSFDRKKLQKDRPGLAAIFDAYTTTRQASRLVVKWEPNK
jgi:putative phage-type endonuclease